jgi:hypothetical protein
MLAERLVQTRLEERIEWYTEDSRRYEQLLVSKGFSEDEASRERQRFDDHPFEVIQGYARSAGVMPVLAIVLGNDENVDDYIGEDAPLLGESDDEDDEDELDYYRAEDGSILDPHMRRWSTRLDFYIYAGNPDIARYLYCLAKHICVSSRKHWHDLNFEDVTYSGAELAPDPRYLPADTYTRRFSMTFRYHDYYTDEDSVMQPSEVNAAVNDGEAPSPAMSETDKAELEDYPHRVTPYQPEED